MSGAPVSPPEIVIAQIEHRLADHSVDDFAIDDESDGESVAHVSAARRFSRRESRNAQGEEISGILTKSERRASRRDSERSRRASDIRIAPGISQLRQENDRLRRPSAAAVPPTAEQMGAIASTSGTNARPGDTLTGNSLKITDSTIAARRPSRTAIMMQEEITTGLGMPASIRMAETKPIQEEGERSLPQTPAAETLEYQEPEDPRATGTIGSWRGGIILATACFAQLVDNIWMTSINIAVPRIAEEFGLQQGSQSWLISAYTLTFGGFLLLAGVLSDRYGRRLIFCGGMVWMAIFSVAVGVSKSGIQCIIFRALQGLGAAASVPSAIGVLSNFFVGKDRHRALSMFGAAGAVGFVVGLVLGGILSGTIGWRYLFYINSGPILLLAISAWFSFPEEKNSDGRKPGLDFWGAGMGTSGMILLTFALSQSEVEGWNKPVIIVTLIMSVVVLFGFTFVEKKIDNPIMPLYLWRLPSFAGIWCAAFLMYCWWASVVYYLTLICQEVLGLSALMTGVLLIPMGVVGFIVSLATGRLVERFSMKPLLAIGLLLGAVAALPAAFITVGNSFWAYIFPTSIVAVTGISLGYNVASIALVSAVPSAAKSLAGGLINTAFQIGSGVGLAITSVVNESVLKNYAEAEQHDPAVLMAGYKAALFTASGLCGGACLLSFLAVKGGQQATAGMMVH